MKYIIKAILANYARPCYLNVNSVGQGWSRKKTAMRFDSLAEARRFVAERLSSVDGIVEVEEDVARPRRVQKVRLVASYCEQERRSQRIANIDTLVRKYEGINDDTDVVDLIAGQLSKDPFRSDEEVARTVAQLINQP